MLRRRDFLQSAALLSTLSATGIASAAAPSSIRGPARAFDYAALKGEARAMAGKAFEPSAKLAPSVLQELSYDQYQSIRFRREQALWHEDDGHFRIEFFHMGRGFKEPVRMYEIVDGQAREILYRPELFDLSRSGVNQRSLGKDLAFAGFRIHGSTNWDADVAAFLGASYFRGVGSDTRQFGLSARGLAIDTAMPEPEEFPRFTSYYFERPALYARTLIIYGLMDSPSVTGAYRFAVTPGAPQVVEVDAAIYPRKSIRRLGIAPLTSMYQCGENDRRMGYDWRPEIHDSDGLSMHTGAGEWLWRPLENPGMLRFNSYLDQNPRGFGLLQRDRNFEHYQDDGVFYERRPSLWIEPRAGWGKGAVQLTEIPTPDETFDNIVAFWNPETPPKAGDELLYSYRMYWGTHIPVFPSLAQVVATRVGLGGVIGQRRRYFSWRFAVDFAGGELAALPERAEVEPVIAVSRGTAEITSARPLKPINGYRAMFDLKLPDDSMEPIDIRLFLRHKRLPLSETWTYQYSPPSPEDRQRYLQMAGH
jgi:periplasmic glucans biosynthesis protein